MPSRHPWTLWECLGVTNGLQRLMTGLQRSEDSELRALRGHPEKGKPLSTRVCKAESGALAGSTRSRPPRLLLGPLREETRPWAQPNTVTHGKCSCASSLPIYQLIWYDRKYVTCTRIIMSNNYVYSICSSILSNYNATGYICETP